jgi:hypothetical protein
MVATNYSFEAAHCPNSQRSIVRTTVSKFTFVRTSVRIRGGTIFHGEQTAEVTATDGAINLESVGME